MFASVNPLSLRILSKLRRRVRLLLHGENPRHFFDLCDCDPIDRLLEEAALPPLECSPRAIAFRAGDSIRGDRIFELRDDLRRAIPLALTPAQRGAYLRWFLVAGGRCETDATLADLLRSLFEHDAASDRGLVASYLVQPDWQERFPHALTAQGWEPFKAWVASEFGIASRWLTRASLPAKFTIRQPSHSGVNAIGLFRYVSGLQQAATSVVDALNAAGIATELRDVPLPRNPDGRSRTGFDGLERFPVTLVNTGLDMPVNEAYRLAGLHPRRDVYRIAMWWWELERLPAAWLDRGRDVDEIWAPTAFIASALRALGRPVFTMLPSVRVPEVRSRPKSDFGLSPEKFTFLFAFDMLSRMPRKNPLGLIRAFRRAFAPHEPAELAIKVSRQDEAYPEWWAQLRTAASDNGVLLIDRNLGRDELLGLMNAADAYVSLHRSEGFGLTMAEAMLLGKPTIASAYSGNLDFMTPTNSYLVRCERSAIVEDIPPYPKGYEWVEPSIEHAAELMRRVFDDREESRAIAERGRASAAALLSPEASGRRMVKRLRELGRL